MSDADSINGHAVRSTASRFVEFQCVLCGETRPSKAVFARFDCRGGPA